MQVPNWQKHSKKEQKRTLKPRKLQQRKEARRQLINRLLKTSDSRRGFYNVETDKEINDRKHTGVKGTLAKLLATEDLVIEHKNCETASFDVDKRVLTLPNWEKATEEVYDLLVAHEVGHALFTPKTVWDNVQCPRSYINVTEDARVEKHEA